MKTKSSFAVLIFFIILGIGIALAYARFGVQANTKDIWIGVISFFIALIVSSAIKIADQWEKAAVLRLGRFHSLRGPGLFFIIPVIDTIPYWIDIRVITTSFTAEKTLTKDTVPVDVDAVLFWKVLDPKKAAIDVADYKSAINWASQTALRDVIGKTMLSDMLEGRDKISNQLQKIIDERTEPWGIGESYMDCWWDAEKVDELICKIYLKPGMRVLDIGCGWGAFGKYAAEKYNVEVVGITVSKEQVELGRNLCGGLPVEFRLMDYRDVNENFDRIVSVGMIEHVGYKNYKI